MGCDFKRDWKLDLKNTGNHPNISLSDETVDRIRDEFTASPGNSISALTPRTETPTCSI